MSPAIFQLRGKPGQAARWWAHNDVRPQQIHRPHTVPPHPSVSSSLKAQVKKKREKDRNTHTIFQDHNSLGRIKCLPLWRRSSLMETNVDTSHPRTCSQLTHCLIKVIYRFIYERLKVAVKWVHAALILQSALLLYFHLNFNGDNLL